MAITLFGSATTPADNAGSSLGPTVVLTPPASMVDGDLVLVSVRYRASSTTLTVSDAAGQDWQSPAQYNATNIRARLFWCRFNGTWSGSGTPSFTVTSGGNNIDAQMFVFRPTSAAYTWTLESGPNGGTYAAPSTPFTVTITGRTTVAASTVTLGCWHSVDDNSWGSLSGAGWSKTNLTAQYRNNDTADNSSTFAYYVATSASTAVPNVSQNQSALGGDAGSTALFTFAETLVAAAVAGVAATAGVGALTTTNTVIGLLGLESVTAIGALTVPLTGASNASVSVAGVSATAACGAMALLISSVVTPTSAGASALAGALAASTSVVPAGVSASGAAGTLAAVGALAGVVPVPGVVSNAAVGSLAITEVVVGLLGVSASASVGLLLGQGAGLVLGAAQPPSVFATAQVGALAVSVMHSLAGVEATAVAESLGLSAALAEIDGNEAAALTASLVAHTSVVVPAVSASTAAGVIATLESSVVVPLGAVSVVTVGNAVGIPSGLAVVGPEGVEAAVAVGAMLAAWTCAVMLDGVESVANAAEIGTEGGESTSVEVFPGGVQATAEVGDISTGQSVVGVPGNVAACFAGEIAAIGRSPSDVTGIRGAGNVRSIRARAMIRGTRAKGRTRHG